MTQRVLFFAESVTLAHVGRPLALAAALLPQHQVTIAVDSRYRRFAERAEWQTVPLHSIASATFTRRLAMGSPVYTFDELQRYVEEDLALIERTRPDLVVGDFRLSLSVSARLSRVPYATLTNAYWSPYCVDRSYPLPALPFTRVLPLTVARRIFETFSPVVMRRHCEPLNRLRSVHGLPQLEDDLRGVYTDADYVLYTDAHGMFAMNELPPSHGFIGPVSWAPAVAPPVWWQELPADRPIIYATLGSSGRGALLREVLAGLSGLPVTVIASTAGAPAPRRLPPNARVADYLPGDEAALKASVVICNGGSPTSHQALAAGVPVLGIASNMDQFLNMRGIEKAGAGLSMRADRFNANSLERAARELLKSGPARAAAMALAPLFQCSGTAARFADFVNTLGKPRPVR